MQAFLELLAQNWETVSFGDTFYVILETLIVITKE